MQTSRFQLGLIATLAVGLGFSLASSDAIGYPAGPTISLGTNPLVAKGGTITGTDSASILTAPPDQQVVITDLIVSAWDQNDGCAGQSNIQLLVDGVSVASLHGGLYRPSANFSTFSSVVKLDLQSGIPVGPDQALTIQTNQISQSYCSGGFIDFRYTVTGYYAQP